MLEINNVYRDLCRQILNSDKVGNTYEIRNAKINLYDIEHNIVGIRDISMFYLLGEWMWYLSGRNDVDFISVFGKMWRSLSDDGKTNNSAYGYLIKEAFGFNQVEKIVELLKKDPNSRRAVININTPNVNVIETKDEPCTIALQYFLRDGKLHSTTVMRSNDIFLGFPYDVAFFTELQKTIADKLGVEYGTYTHIANSLHVYDRDIDKIKAIVDNPVEKNYTVNRDNFHSSFMKIVDYIDNNLDQPDLKEQIKVLFNKYNIIEHED